VYIALTAFVINVLVAVVVTASARGLANLYGFRTLRPDLAILEREEWEERQASRLRSCPVHASTDVVASWNSRHVVRFDKIQAFNAVNVEAGYRLLAIHSPGELASDDSDSEATTREREGHL
jgi:hypothetical protein